MKIGTKSVLIGAHFFLTHWLFVARGWFSLYGFRKVQIGWKEITTYPKGEDGQQWYATVRLNIFASIWNPKVWIAFIIHDWGYWGKPNMDGKEGESHPEWACKKMNQWFGAPWGAFVLDHSRFYAKKGGRPVSPLCYADKMAIVFEPTWFYLPRVRWTGELEEYMRGAATREASDGYTPDLTTPESWHCGIRDYMRRWVEEHKDGRADTWTKAAPTGEQRGGYV